MEPHSNVYYIRNTDGTYKPCKSATGVRNDIGADIFRYKGLIYEGSTGVFMCDESRLDGYLKDCKGKEDKYKELVQKTADKYGLSSRYTQPEVKKDQVFPRDESRKLPRTLYRKERCYFSRLYNENGIELYTMDKQKSGSPTLYAPCNGWMIGLGPLHQLDRFIAILSAPDFDLYNRLLEDYEKELADPQKWADVGVAEFLERREEADRHNRPIREARDLEHEQYVEQREAEEKEREERARLEYENAIKEAEKAILEGQPVNNKEIGSKSLILQLFREYGIELPLKTQGWVKSSLAEIHQTDHGWSYRYYGRPSTVIHDYLDKLAEAVEIKHQHIPAETYEGDIDFSHDDLETDEEDDMEI
ncbi:MAG: hypothetical protein GX936_09355 [Clostridiales bacterium]|nr:hypothetical protein [Clostridiales bacterium]